jgi:catechol 2,3-dioxygenase-like lactoylglutathione lyase family enzyme
MFDHVGIRVSDRAASERFYDITLAALEIEKTHSDDWLAEWEDLAMSAEPDRPVTRGLHIGFVAPSRAHVDAFHRAGVEAGYRDDGAPGERDYTPAYYGAFLLDPDGNSAEAVHHEDLRQGEGWIDHLWLRTQNPAAIREFYAAIAPVTGFEVRMPADDHVQIVGPSGSFSYVAGPPTKDVHIAFGATDDATVDAFHRAATEAGYRDNGAPGERPQYHAGYYGAFVLDPDGHNIEVVNHNR